VEAPKSAAAELVYTHSPRGFALISQRTDTLQRMYFQCDPAENVDNPARGPDQTPSPTTALLVLSVL
jgi:hypothetical protein